MSVSAVYKSVFTMRQNCYPNTVIVGVVHASNWNKKENVENFQETNVILLTIGYFCMNFIPLEVLVHGNIKVQISEAIEEIFTVLVGAQSVFKKKKGHDIKRKKG